MLRRFLFTTNHVGLKVPGSDPDAVGDSAIVTAPLPFPDAVMPARWARTTAREPATEIALLVRRGRP